MARRTTAVETARLFAVAFESRDQDPTRFPDRIGLTLPVPVPTVLDAVARTRPTDRCRYDRTGRAEKVQAAPRI